MTETHNLPLPGDTFEGHTVIASCWGNDEPADGVVFATLLLLAPAPPYYVITQIEWHGGWRITEETPESHPNIIPAAEAYSDAIGGY